VREELMKEVVMTLTMSVMMALHSLTCIGWKKKTRCEYNIISPPPVKMGRKNNPIPKVKRKFFF